MERVEPKSFGQLFPQLFLFPLILVVVGVLVWLFFKASAEDGRSVEDLISDIESGGEHARRQDAYALALAARDISSSKSEADRYFSPQVTRKLLRLHERSKDDPETSKFVTMALGRAGDPELTMELMNRLALGEGSTLETRVQAVQALAISRSEKALDTLKKVLDGPRHPDEWELHWYALAGLANIGHESGVPYLRAALSDPRREIRWNAAGLLATVFGDASGREILLKLLDWDHLDGERGDHPAGLRQEEKECNMVMALGALHRIDGEKLTAVLEEKTKDRRSLKVQDAAQRLLLGKKIDWTSARQMEH